MIEQFHFLRPLWLLALLPLLATIWLLLKSKVKSNWESLCDKELLPYVIIGYGKEEKLLPMFLIGICGILTILALAGPAWEMQPKPVFETKSALVIALGLNQSMEQTDISPSRIVRAKQKISEILSEVKGGQSALVVFAGSAFTVTPLTDDIEVIESLLSAVTVDIMPVQGNRTDIALSKSLDLIRESGITKGDILLLTDEVDFANAKRIAQLIKEQGYRLSILGIQASADFNNTIKQMGIESVYEESMRDLAMIGGGHYRAMELKSNEGVKAMVELFSSGYVYEGVIEAEVEADTWIDRGPVLIAILIPFVLMLFRKNILIIPVLLLLPYSEQLYAFEWETVWLRADQRALRLFNEGDYRPAAELFENTEWKGVSYYLAGDFDEAIKYLQLSDNIGSNYNLANAMARKGEYEVAILIYNNVLQEKPGHDDARYNKKILELELEKKEKSNPGIKNTAQGEEKETNQNQPQQSAQHENEEADNSQTSEDDSKNTDQDETDPDQAETVIQAGQETFKHTDNETIEQWLRTIPNDPGGLLRRKFLYQYRYWNQQ